jgi:5,10-methylenetetrahydrofolate reductase
MAEEFVVTVELETPKGADPDEAIAVARSLLNLVDAVNLPDAPMAHLRMSPLMLGALIQQRTQLDVIPHVTCRDRNVLALQADLLGASALGIERVLILNGDPIERGDHPNAKAVFEIGPVELVRLIGELNVGRNWAGGELTAPTQIAAGVAVNPTATDLGKEVQKFWAKVEAGAEFAQSQPVFSALTVEKFLRELGSEPPIPIYFGILPLRSAKMAERMGSWAQIPGELTEKLASGGRDAGIVWAKNTIHSLREFGAAGVHIYPMGKPEVVKELLN